MKKVFVIFFSAVVVFSACKDPGGNKDGVAEKRVAKGDRTYGGTFNINESEEFQTLFPYAMIDVVSAHIVTQIYEGLVSLNTKNLAIIPRIAESWEIDESATVYTFKLKKGVRFQNADCFPDGKGREVTAKDFKYSFELLCSYKINDSIENTAFARTLKDKLLGANEYFDASRKGKPGFDLSGIKVIDDYTLQLTLTKPSISILYILAYPASCVVAKEAVDKYGRDMAVGTGPFEFADIYNETDPVTGDPYEVLVLTRNEGYYGYDTLGNQLPYLDSIVFSFINSQKRELELFQNGKLDMIIGLPAESVSDIVEQHIAYFEKKPPKFVLERSADMITNFYEFNLNSIFRDKRLRQAFCHAVDKTKIVESVLKGEAYGPAVHGLNPPSFKEYDITKIKGLEYNPDKAKKLIAEAGFPNGRNFPTIRLELNSGGFRNTAVAFEIQKQLQQVLNINIDLEVVPMSKKIEDQRYAKADLFRSAWVADYPSPENFLLLLYGKTVPETLEDPSFINTPRYVNSKYDMLYEQGISAKTIDEAYKYLAEAEQLMVEDAPIMPLWYDENFRLVQSNIHNFRINPMHYMDFSEVYIQAIKVEEEESPVVQ